MNAPSAVNERAWHFVVMYGKILDDILLINGKKPKSAPVSTLVCQDLPAEKAKGCSAQDCDARTQNIMLAVHAKGLSAVWTVVITYNVKAIQSRLNITERVQPFSCLPVGYSAEGEKNTASRFDENKIYQKSW
jgi:nitroreductase